MGSVQNFRSCLWTRAEEERLRELAPEYLPSQICQMLRRTEGSVRNRARRLELRLLKPGQKTPEQVRDLVEVALANGAKTPTEVAWLAECEVRTATHVLRSMGIHAPLVMRPKVERLCAGCGKRYARGFCKAGRCVAGLSEAAFLLQHPVVVRKLRGSTEYAHHALLEARKTEPFRWVCLGLVEEWMRRRQALGAP